MEFLEKFVGSAFLVPFLLFFALIFTLMLAWRKLTRNNDNLPPNLSFFKIAWSGYRSGVPIYEYARCLKDTHGAVYSFKVFGQLVVCLNDFDSIKDAFNNPRLNDRPNLSGERAGIVGKYILIG